MRSIVTAIELVNIDSNIPIFNQWSNINDQLYEIANFNSIEHMEELEKKEQ